MARDVSPSPFPAAAAPPCPSPAPAPAGLVWPKAADERPTSAQIARALWLAAGLAGEQAVLARAIAEQGSFRHAILRSRWMAMDAILTLYPRVRTATLGRLLGASNPVQQLNLARGRSWWRAADIALVMAGI